MTKAGLLSELEKFPDDTNVVIVDREGYHLDIGELVYITSTNEITIRPIKEKGLS